ncbi:MAG: sialidase family protein [Planctomycetia bacterium]|nr:sialidase family protein [Planctomycetia bacterium]
MHRLKALTGLLLCVLFAPCANCEAQQETNSEGSSLDPPKIWLELPDEYLDANRKFQGVPSLQPTSPDRLWVSWTSGTNVASKETDYGENAENIVLLATSGDRGENWSKPIMVIDPPGIARAYDSSLWQDPTGRLWHFWAQAEQGVPPMLAWDGRGGIWCMTCDHPELGENAVWSEPRRICDGIMNNQPVCDSQGRYLLPVSVVQMDAKFFIPPEKRGALVYSSDDQGKTFNFLGRAEVPKKDYNYDEHNIVEKKDGSLWMAIRTVYGMGESFSFDQGKTWSVAAPMPGVSHTCSRFIIRRLQSGKLLLVKNGKIQENCGRTRLMAFLSDDDGKTWMGGLLLDSKPYASYPTGQQAQDGTIYVAWDRDRFVEKEIMMARFTEEDILAGKFVADGSRAGIVANKALGQ